MKINVGTTNIAKLEAVRDILEEYPHLAGGEVSGVEVNSGVGIQPLTLEDTITGALNRAKNAFVNCDYSIGIESGLMKVPQTKSGYMDVCVCAIFDGKENHLGLSSAWEFPDPKIMRFITEEGLDMSQAINRAGMTDNPKIGAAEGAIGILTKGRLTRKKYTQEALRTALIHLDYE